MQNKYGGFTEKVWDYYHTYGRDLPWRKSEPENSFEPYKILVSEIMLQQTQVARVEPKYTEFLKAYPTVQELAKASLGDVLKLWSGLGYNRRAKFLWQAAQMVVSDYGGKFPKDQKELTRLPGVGFNTAGALCAYAYNQPVLFIETNIRTVYIHHFFKDRDDVDDKELLPYIELTLDQENPREWYWALMDYGSFLKTHVGNLARNSQHYTRQSQFHGSRRQVRGQIIKLLRDVPLTSKELSRTIPDERLLDVLQDLIEEGLIEKTHNQYGLT